MNSYKQGYYYHRADTVMQRTWYVLFSAFPIRRNCFQQTFQSSVEFNLLQAVGYTQTERPLTPHQVSLKISRAEGIWKSEAEF